LCTAAVRSDDSDSLRRKHIPVAVTGPYFHVQAFARFEDTFGVFEKTSVLTTIVAAQVKRRDFCPSLAAFSGGHILVPGAADD
jgi:hypothetical protein